MGATWHLAPGDVPDLLDHFLHASLIHREDWAKLSQAVRTRLEDTTDRNLLLPRLVEARLLTQYQADRIAAGTTRGLVLGNYRVLNRLGAGGMGVVFLAEHVNLRRMVAIKVLPMSASTEGNELLSRFFNEIRMIAQLQHPNIVWAIDTGELPASDPDSPTLYYHVMEYVPGKDLEELVRLQGPYSVSRACDLIYQVASALAEAEKHHLVHRDIKPSNIMVTAEGQAKLLDFGLARTLDHRQTQPGVVLGSIDYVAPEQVLDASAVDTRADIYSLGGTLFWCLTGKVPFPSDASLAQILRRRTEQPPPSIRAIRPELSKEINDLIVRMMATRAEDRYPSPTAVMRTLLPFLRSDSGEFCYLPRKNAGGPQSEVEIQQSPEDATGQRVLLVDDEEGIRTLSRTVLEAQGIVCGEASSGPEALAAIRARPYDVILLDVDMPEMSGREVLRQVRDAPPVPNLKVIMASGRASSDEMSAMILAGADDFVSKPFSMMQLHARVKGALRLKSSQDRSDVLMRQLHAENARTEQNLQARDSDLVDARNAMVLALAELVAYRGAETSAHLQRMQSYVRAFAEELARLPGLAGQLEPPFIHMLEGAVPLHDIGMIGLPERILVKPGKLDPDEWIIMQSHTTIASDIFQKVARKHHFSAAFLQMVIEITRHHHERWDGRGYPDRLGGSDIPLAARIVAVADVYDALRSRRPHKPALSHTAAVQVMTEVSAGHFDPELLQAFHQGHEQFARIFKEHPD
jgi:response regulator RpfG family c-di-GMP phosphodiesterase/serine/threonine protein kinase